MPADGGSAPSTRDQDLAGQLGAILRDQRQRTWLTQAQLARLAGTTQATVARIESATRSTNLAMVQRLFAALGCQLKFTLEPLNAELDEESQGC